MLPSSLTHRPNLSSAPRCGYPLVAADLASSGGGWPLMDLGRWGATVAADLASGNATTTAAVSGDDDHGEMGIWGCRPDEATRGAPTPPMRGFCSWLRSSRAQARRLTRFFCWLGFALRNHCTGCQLGSARLRRGAVRPQARVERCTWPNESRYMQVVNWTLVIKLGA